MKPEVRIAVAVVLVFLAGIATVKVGTTMKRAREARLKVARENRQWTAVNNLTPEQLINRCGQPVEDHTKDLYPMVAREMSYKSSDEGMVVMAFSKTGEEGSNWVFMSMKTLSRGKEYNYETPSAKIAALPCLDSQK
jgi:hypothetical protein